MYLSCKRSSPWLCNMKILFSSSYLYIALHTSLLNNMSKMALSQNIQVNLLPPTLTENSIRMSSHECCKIEKFASSAHKLMTIQKKWNILQVSKVLVGGCKHIKELLWVSKPLRFKALEDKYRTEIAVKSVQFKHFSIIIVSTRNDMWSYWIAIKI